MSIRAVNSLRYNASYDESAFQEDMNQSYSDTREDTGSYSVPHPEDEEGYRADFIEGPSNSSDGFIGSEEMDYEDEYATQSGSEDWGFEIAQDPESPRGVPTQNQSVLDRLGQVAASNASSASTAASRREPREPRSPLPITYPPLPTSRLGNGTTAQREPIPRVRPSMDSDQVAADFEISNQGSTVRPSVVNDAEATMGFEGANKRPSAQKAQKAPAAPKPVQENLRLEISRDLAEEFSAPESRQRPPPLNDVDEPREPTKARSSVGSLMKGSLLRPSKDSGKGKTSKAEESPPQSPRTDKRGSKKSPKSSGRSPESSPMSDVSSSGQSSPERRSHSDTGSSPRSSNTSPRNSKGKRNSKKGNRNSKEGRNSRNSRTRDRRPLKERALAYIVGCPAAYARNVPARCPCMCVLISLVVVGIIIGAGLALKVPSVDTDLDSLMKTVVNSSITHDAFVAATIAIRENYGGRRLQSSIAAYVHSDIYLAYELSENSPHNSITDFEVLLKIFKFEDGLRTLTGWSDECTRADIDFREFCDPGISFVNIMLPTLQMRSGSVLPDSLKLDGKGQDALPKPASFYLLNKFSLAEVMLPKDFDVNVPYAPVKAFRTAFFFKVPVGTSLDSAAVLSDSVRKVRERWEEFLKLTVFPYLSEAEEKLPGVRVYYSGSSVQGLEVISTLMQDLKYAIGSLVFVLVYLLFHTRSLISSVLGLIIIISAVPLALVTFMLIASSNTVNIASFLSMFLVVGLGADVVFVYTDFWRDSAYVSKDVVYRTIWTYKHAGKASLATTVTTALSFFANIASVLRALRDFGFFMGLCVVFVWIVVSVIYVPVLIFNDRRRLSCGVDHCHATLNVCCGSRSRILSRWVRRANQWKYFILSASVLLGLGALVAALMQVQSDLSTPNIFPGDHNQNRGVEVLDMFAPPASLQFVAKVEAEPPPPEVDVCPDATFSDLLPCGLFWCEAQPGVLQEESRQCTCYHRFYTACPTDTLVKSTTRFVGLGAEVSSKEAIEVAGGHLTNITAEGTQMFNALVQTTRPPMVIERWETGDAVINNVMDVSYDTLSVGADAPCGMQALCYCGESICNNQEGWDSEQVYLPNRRLQSKDEEGVAQGPPLWPRSLSEVSIGKRATVEVAFGIVVDPSVPLFGERPDDERWSFMESYQPAHPRAQRDMYYMCSKVTPELIVVQSRCWIMDFRSWLLKRGQRFPLPADIFDSYIVQFAKSSTTGGRFSREFLWRKDGVLKASYVQFEVNMHKEAPPEEALEYRDQWDRYLRQWNREASPFARGAFHVSKLWVQAQAQQELMSSTVTTLSVLAVLSLLSMLLFTKDFMLSLFVVTSTVWVVAGLFFFIVVVCQWPIGPIEAIALIVFIGYALTYSLHVAHVYCDREAVPEDSQVEGSPSSVANLRLQRTNFALRSIGGAILGSALTTAGCTVFLLLCTLTIFLKLGAVVLVVTLLSVVASFVVMPSALLLFGPLRPGHAPRCMQMIKERGRASREFLRRRSSVFIDSATRQPIKRNPMSSISVDAAAFADGVMEDQPVPPPPSSEKVILPGAGGITRNGEPASSLPPPAGTTEGTVAPRSGSRTPELQLPAAAFSKPSVTKQMHHHSSKDYIPGLDDDMGSAKDSSIQL